MLFVVDNPRIHDNIVAVVEDPLCRMEVVEMLEVVVVVL